MRKIKNFLSKIYGKLILMSVSILISAKNVFSVNHFDDMPVAAHGKCLPPEPPKPEPEPIKIFMGIVALIILLGIILIPFIIIYFLVSFLLLRKKNKEKAKNRKKWLLRLIIIELALIFILFLYSVIFRYYNYDLSDLIDISSLIN